MHRFKRLAHWLSGIIGFAASTYFAWTIYRDGIPQNAATWGMTLLLDIVGLFLVLKAKNEEPFLQTGWVVAAACIFAATLLGKGHVHWGNIETISLLLCAFSLVLWRVLNARIAIFAFIAATWMAAVPLGVDYWYKPQPSTLWIWLVTIVTCLLSIYGAKKQDVGHTAVQWAAIVINAAFVFLCVR